MAKNYEQFDLEEDTTVAERKKLKTPRKYCVIFHNDDFTTQEFVVHVLQNFFYKNQDDAIVLMLRIHQEGRAVVGSYTKDVAESKATVATVYCRKNGMPLLITSEPA